MEQYGEILEIKGDMAKVLVKRHLQCEKCTHCTFDKRLIIEAHNCIKAKRGEQVLLEMGSRRILGATFLIYMFPLLMILLGYLIGSSLSSDQKDLIGFLMGMSFLLLSFLLIRYLDTWFGKRWDYRPKIRQIMGGMIDGDFNVEGGGDGLSTLCQGNQKSPNRSRGD